MDAQSTMNTTLERAFAGELTPAQTQYHVDQSSDRTEVDNLGR